MRWIACSVGVLWLACIGCEESTRPGVNGGTAGTTTTSGAPEAAANRAAEFDSGLAKEDQDKVVGRIGSLTITLKEFERRLAQQAPYARARYASVERKKEFLDNLVRFEVLAAEAGRKGYDRDPDVVQQMKQTMVRKLMTSEVQGLVKLSDITDAEMNKYYEDNSDSYHKPEQVRVSHILVTNEARATKLLVELRKKINADRRNYRKVFADFARDRSEDATTKPRGGDLRFFARTEDGGTQPKPLSDAAFALQKVGDVSDVVKTDAGWHVLLLTGRKNRYDRTFEQVKRQIQNRLYRQKKRSATDNFVADLKAKARVEVHEALLERIQVGAKPASAGGGGAVLGPVDPSAPAPGALRRPGRPATVLPKPAGAPN